MIMDTDMDDVVQASGTDPEPDSDSPAANSVMPLTDIAGRIAELAEQQAEFHRRSVHRELVIDHLHEENQRLKAGTRRAILEPVVVDLFRIHESMLRECGRLAETQPRAGKVLASYADELEMVLERCGFATFAAEPGEAFQPGRHAPAGTEVTDDPARHNTVAAPVGSRPRRNGSAGRPGPGSGSSANRFPAPRWTAPPNRKASRRA
jgi:molecular chaperone GrpE